MEQPSLTTVRNQVERKSDNYGMKETTSIQTGRRGTDAQWAGHTPGVVNKNSEGYLRSEESQTHTRPPSPGSSARKISPHIFWLQTPAGIESMEET